jgi:2'-5' RNA ligase
MSNKRLFYALWPDVRQRDRLRDFISPVAKLVEGRAIDRRNWHVTLAFIGDLPERRIPELRERVAQVQVEPFRLTFDRLEFWPRPKVAALVAATVPSELRELVESLNTALSDLGIETEDRTFRPHITVTRNARPFETQRLAQRSMIEWSGFDLIESTTEPGGASYSVLNQ